MSDVEIPDKAVEAARQAREEVIRSIDLASDGTDWRDPMRAALEAAYPLLGTQPPSEEIETLRAALREWQEFGERVKSLLGTRPQPALREAEFNGYLDGLRDAKQAGEDNTDGFGNLYRLDWLDAMEKLREDAFKAMDEPPAVRPLPQSPAEQRSAWRTTPTREQIDELLQEWKVGLARPSDERTPESLQKYRRNLRDALLNLFFGVQQSTSEPNGADR